MNTVRIVVVLFVGLLCQTISSYASEDQPSPEIASTKQLLYTIDRIEAVIYGTEATDMITLSDVKRIGFDGKPKIKEDVIVERLMFQEALKNRIPVDEKVVDDYIEKVAKSFGGTQADVHKMFEEAGYTPEEGRKQFAINYGVNQLIDHKIKARLVVPEKDIVAYYEEYPMVKPASYIVERSVVQVLAGREQEMTKKVNEFVKTGKGLLVGWTQLPEIIEIDLAEDKKFITTLKPGQIHAEKIDDGYELFKLKKRNEARVIPLDERRRDITDEIRKPKFDQLMQDYRKELLQSRAVIYF